MKLKPLLGALLQPACLAASGLSGAWRVWAWAKLKSQTTLPVHHSVVVLGTVEMHGTRRIALGADCYLYRGIYFETRQEGLIEIGRGVVISRGVHIVSFSRVYVGDGTIIGEYTSIRDANHRIRTNEPIRHSGHDSEPVHIGSNVWIGRGVCILPGTHIGDNAVVGANAVVTNDIPAGAVVGGIPARALKGRASA